MSISVGITEIRKSFGQTHALKGVSLTIAAGSIHGLLGPNGSGKSTLIRILTGIERADRGTVAIDGAVQRSLRPAKARALGIELVPQELALIPLVKVWENIVLGDEPGRFVLSRKQGRAMARQVLDQLGL